MQQWGLSCALGFWQKRKEATLEGPALPAAIAAALLKPGSCICEDFRVDFWPDPLFSLQTHMSQVSRCVEALACVIESYPKELSILAQRASEISELEYVADMTKNHIQRSLAKTLFLPVNKEMLIQALAYQDSIADLCEDVAHLLSCQLLPIDSQAPLGILFREFFSRNYETFLQAVGLVKEYDALVSASFGGCEAERVDLMVEEVAIGEHDCRLAGYTLLRQVYASAGQMVYSEFDLWQRVIRQTGQIAFQSEKLVYSIRRMLNNR